MQASPPKAQYDAFASNYSKMEDLPGEVLATATLRRVLGDVQGLKILDLGGGSGIYARMVIEMGAESVTCVDLSPGMVQVGKELEAREGRRRSRIEYYASDCAQPLDHLELPREGYDLVMGNWVLCYAGSVAELEGMWWNIVTYVKPGGRFVGLINLDPKAKSMLEPKYGIQSKVVGTVEHGVKVHITAFTEPLIEFDAFLLERRLYEQVPERLGIGVRFEDSGEVDLPRDADRGYWQEFFDEPYFTVCTAVKEC